MANNGKKSEEIVRVILKGFQETQEAFFARLYDSTTAKGGYVPPQAGDFYGLFQGDAYVIEVKSSELYNTMMNVPKSYIRASQIVGARLWIRAGGRGLFIFHGLSGNIFEVWESADIIKWVLKGEKLTAARRLVLARGKQDFETKLLRKLKWL